MPHAKTDGNAPPARPKRGRRVQPQTVSAVSKGMAVRNVAVTPRKGMPSQKLDETEFRRRYLEQVRDAGFEPVREALDHLAAIAWAAYRDERKSPHTVARARRLSDHAGELVYGKFSHEAHDGPQVCMDGGNPVRRRHGKKAEEAKPIELAGWTYPRQLSGRHVTVVVRGDVEGAENVRRSMTGWMKFMQMVPAGPDAELDRYIGHFAWATRAGKQGVAGLKIRAPRQMTLERFATMRSRAARSRDAGLVDLPTTDWRRRDDTAET